MTFPAAKLWLERTLEVFSADQHLRRLGPFLLAKRAIQKLFKKLLLSVVNLG